MTTKEEQRACKSAEARQDSGNDQSRRPRRRNVTRQSDARRRGIRTSERPHLPSDHGDLRRGSRGSDAGSDPGPGRVRPIRRPPVNGGADREDNHPNHRARRSGGSASLVRLLTEQWAPLEADFARYYQIDLRDAIGTEQPITPRRLAALIHHLPPDSAISRARAGGAVWTQETELAATTVELIHLLFLATIRAAGVEAKDVPEPLEIPRPWEPKPRSGPGPARPATLSEVAAAFGAATPGKDN